MLLNSLLITFIIACTLPTQSGPGGKWSSRAKSPAHSPDWGSGVGQRVSFGSCSNPILGQSGIGMEKLLFAPCPLPWMWVHSLGNRQGTCSLLSLLLVPGAEWRSSCSLPCHQLPGLGTLLQRLEAEGWRWLPTLSAGQGDVSLGKAHGVFPCCSTALRDYEV